MTAPVPRSLLCVLSIAFFVAAVPAPRVVADDHTIGHVLNRLGYGARPGDIERVRTIGILKYIERQLDPARIDDGALDAKLEPLTTLRMASSALAREYFIPAQQAKRRRTDQAMDASPELMGARRVMVELNEQKILRAIYSERQLQEVLTDFWFNHFNVYAGKGADRQFLTAYERDAIRPNVLGNFRSLLGSVAHSPAMLFYLDNWLSTDPGPSQTAAPDSQPQRRRPTGLNENYARELMELHTLGVDGGYTQQDVIDVARAFTGWTIDRPRSGGPFTFDPRLHDRGEKHVLGHTIEAGGGEDDGEQVLDILAGHPATARFIATKLVRHFVSDEPPPALIDRAARQFVATKGDLREVVRTIVESPEFFAPEAQRAKVKTPLEFVVSALRVSSADVQRGSGVARALQQLGMPLYQAQPPTGYADTADAWVNAGGLVNRMNFAVALAGNRVPGVNVEMDETQLTALGIGSPEFQRK
jgi:uncharacterized protein (DUF1800 family)